MHVLVVGAGLSGSVAARSLYDAGHGVEVVEAGPAWGGQLRGARANGVLYEPHGAHILHTGDAEVWQYVQRFIDILPYRHYVKTEVADRDLSWPPQVEELQALPQWPEIERELERRPAAPDRTNFETWCLSIMGATLYGWFVEPYTVKQWGVAPTELSSHWAPKRIELRTDGYRDLFRDPYQGYPRGGYLELIDALLAPLPVSMGIQVSADNLEEHAQGFDAVILTVPLDDFFENRLGPLPWRGVHLISRYYPDRERVLSAPVVNHPGLDKAYTRRIETKLMSGETGPTTVVSEEYPGSPARHYPIDDVDGDNRRRAAAYERLAGESFAIPVEPAGRLATYSYIDMDQAVRQGLNVASKVMKSKSARQV